MAEHSYISNAHPAFIDNLYKAYKSNDTIDEGWKKFFEGFDYALDNSNGQAAANGTAATGVSDIKSEAFSDELKAYNLIQAYRDRAHLISDTNPIRKRKDRNAQLELKDFGLTEAYLSQEFSVGATLGLGKATLANIIDTLRKIYCGSIGFEYSQVRDAKAYNWLQNKIELYNGNYSISIEKKKHILRKLNETVVFEQFLHTKYIGQKRFSLEGGESTIPAIDCIIQTAAQLEVEEVVIGMAHRGRLNVLANIMGKTYEQIFNEFEGHAPKHHNMGDGDVKYHMGYGAQIKTGSGAPMQLKLSANPSHLEAVDPVVQGYSRAKADEVYSSNYDKILPILIHGDAAIAGQGIVFEVAQMSKLEGYYTGGTIHFVINNQIGFTTNFDDARSSDYSTSVASVVNAPVLHVNGDDVEAVVFAAETAAEYRQLFNSDIYVDMVCYRKHGHNEGDDPKYTQPGMYKLIGKHKNPRELYIEKLSSRNEISQDLAKKMDKEFWSLLQDRLDMVKQKPLPYVYQAPEKAWKALRKSTREDFDKSPETGISKTMVKTITTALSKVPDGFKPLRKINKYLEKRRKSMQENQSLDWAAAELLAYSSILLGGNNVRMSGQDVKRGTFSHRHAMIYDEETFQEYNRLNHFNDKQGKFLVYNSLLSEYAVMGFEFGYSVASPNSLTIWEGQFGDFVNGAQIMIDQFLTSSESKWQWQSGLVLLLPHGYAGQGPEHSSARLERFLQGCAEQNMCVVNITDPANFFHVIRRQQTRPFRKPLIVMSPKSLLRHPKCVSSIFDIIGKGKRFQEIIDDSFVKNKKKVKRILLCTGKIYYDLAAKQEADNRQDVAIVRIEQLYPLTRVQLNKVIGQYPKSAKITWVQEEPANMGALWHMMYRLRNADYSFDFISRKTSASPATGYKAQHDEEQAEILKKAFA